jgi:hypothetical protein
MKSVPGQPDPEVGFAAFATCYATLRHFVRNIFHEFKTI